MIGDRVNARWFMALGLVCSAVLNVCFGLSTAVVFLGTFWMANGWFQGIGFPPCARLMTHWFRPRELATKMSIWNMSHGIGAAVVAVLCGYLVSWYGDWRLCFFVPAGIAVVVSGLLLIFLRDTPQSVGLPPVEGTATIEGEGAELTANAAPARPFREVLVEKVFRNKYIWILSLANFFVYTIRYAVFDWGPTMLKESKGLTLAHAGWMMAGFEVAGLVGALLTGWLTDRLFRGRGARMCVFCMIGCTAAVALFWATPKGHIVISTLTLMAAGFFVYGPQALVGICAANLATKEAAATAVGLTGLFGYASGLLSGWGMGWTVQHYGWDRAFVALLGMACAGIVLFLAAWPAPRDGYGDATAGPRGFPIGPTSDRPGGSRS
jgi:OPA family glycerol-3-phosphate transporter-like MFS transporter/OPA family sugar phosphate sensor protein UhpC-like MFS transporter